MDRKTKGKMTVEISNEYEDYSYLLKALEEAKKSHIVQKSNQKVGCVIIKNKKVIGKGFRTTEILQEKPYKDITIHAEHHALNEAGKNAKGATLYSTLEPCAVRSVLPGGWCPPNPCCQLIYEAGISKVVFAKTDKNFGEGGAKYLLERGVKVCMVEIGNDEFEKLINLTIWREDVAKIDKGKTFKYAK